MDSLARIADAKLPTPEQKQAGVVPDIPFEPLARAEYIYARAQQGFALTPRHQFRLALACLRDCGLEPKGNNETLF